MSVELFISQRIPVSHPKSLTIFPSDCTKHLPHLPSLRSLQSVSTFTLAFCLITFPSPSPVFYPPTSWNNPMPSFPLFPIAEAFRLLSLLYAPCYLSAPYYQTLSLLFHIFFVTGRYVHVISAFLGLAFSKSQASSLVNYTFYTNLVVLFHWHSHDVHSIPRPHSPQNPQLGLQEPHRMRATPSQDTPKKPCRKKV